MQAHLHAFLAHALAARDRGRWGGEITVVEFASSSQTAQNSNTTSITRIVAPGFLRRAVEAVRRYAFDVQQSREELSESTQEKVLPPIPPADHAQRRRRQR
jgi:hypothetical protein